MGDAQVLGWRKASYSGGDGACVEVAAVPGRRWVRDSKDPNGPQLEITAERFAVLLDGIKADRFSPHRQWPMSTAPSGR